MQIWKHFTLISHKLKEILREKTFALTLRKVKFIDEFTWNKKVRWKKF